MKVKVKWLPEYNPWFNRVLGIYYHHTLPQTIYLKRDLIENPYNQIPLGYRAFHRLEIPIWKYVIYHELFHHISQKEDSEEFENKLLDFIKKEK